MIPHIPGRAPPSGLRCLQPGPAAEAWAGTERCEPEFKKKIRCFTSWDIIAGPVPPVNRPAFGKPAGR